MQQENSCIMISPVPAIFLLPGFLIIDGILAACCAISGEKSSDEHEKVL